MEKRILVSHAEAMDLCRRARIHGTDLVCDHYSGKERTRTVGDQVSTKSYCTPVSGTIFRFSTRLSFDGFSRVFLEWKWTEHTRRWEVEFEDGVPAEFENRASISGWSILQERPGL